MVTCRLRWAFFQLDTLRRCMPSSIRKALNKLPTTLDETYERALQEIPKENSYFTQANLILRHGTSWKTHYHSRRTTDAAQGNRIVLRGAMRILSGLANYLITTHGEDVNAKCCNRGIPLHASSYKGQLNAASILLSHGVGVNTTNKLKRTAL